MTYENIKHIYIKAKPKKDFFLSYGIEPMPERSNSLYRHGAHVSFYGESIDLSDVKCTDIEISFGANFDERFESYDQFEAHTRKHTEYDSNKSMRQHEIKVKNELKNKLPKAVGFMDQSKDNIKLYSHIPLVDWQNIFQLLNYDGDIYFTFTITKPPRKRQWLIYSFSVLGHEPE